MAGSFFAFLDDIAVLARAAAATMDDVVAGAAKAASKSSAIVVDDIAVSPQYVQGISPSRELPVVWKIAKFSLFNKAIIIAAIMGLSAVAPWIFPWFLIAGGLYLCFEGAEKVYHWLSHRKTHKTAEDVQNRTAKDEASIVKSAATTDLVLSAEIMLISLSNMDSDAVWYTRLGMLIVVGVLMVAVVYGLVGILIRQDDFGFWLTRVGAKRDNDFIASAGIRLVRAMPYVFKGLTIVGTAAMLWVGGHLLMANFYEVGLKVFYDCLHFLTSNIENGFMLWLTDTSISALFGLVAGVIVLGIFLAASKLVKSASNSSSI